MSFSKEDALLRVDTQRERLSSSGKAQDLARIHLLSQLHEHLAAVPEMSSIDRHLVDLVLMDQADEDYEITCAGRVVPVSRASVGRAHDLMRTARNQGVGVPSLLLDYEHAVAVESPTSGDERANLQISIEALLHRGRVLLSKKQQPELAALVEQLQKMLEALSDRQSPLRMGAARAMRMAVVHGSELVRRTERTFAEQRTDSPVPMDAQQSESTQRIAERIQLETRSALTFISTAAHDDVQRRRRPTRPARSSEGRHQVDLPLTRRAGSGVVRFLLPALPGAAGAVAGNWIFAQVGPWVGLNATEASILGGGVLAALGCASANLLLRLHLRSGERRALRRMDASISTSEVLIDRAVHALDGSSSPDGSAGDRVGRIQEWVAQVPEDAADQLRGLLQDAEPLLVYGGTQFLVGLHRIEWDSLVDDLLPASIEKYQALRSATGRSTQVQESLTQQLRMIREAAARLTDISTSAATAQMKAHESFLAQKLGHSDLTVE